MSRSCVAKRAVVCVQPAGGARLPGSASHCAAWSSLSLPQQPRGGGWWECEVRVNGAAGGGGTRGSRTARRVLLAYTQGNTPRQNGKLAGRRADWVLLSGSGKTAGASMEEGTREGGGGAQPRLTCGAPNGEQGETARGRCAGMVNSLMLCSTLLSSAKQRLETCTAAPSCG